MTGMLRSVLREHADSTPAPQVDLDGIIGAGERRARRTRVTTGLAAAAVASAVAGSALVLPGLVPDRGDLATSAPAPFAERRVGYATGDVIHWGEESFSVGAVIRSYVQTDDGFVFTTKNGDVWLYDGTDSQRIGHAESNRLRADDQGSLVAWVASTEAGATQYVVYDTALGEELARVDDTAAGPSREDADGAEVFAVDDGSVYWRADADRMVRFDVVSGDTEVLYQQQPPADPADKQPVAYGIADVAAGQIAYLVDAGKGTEAKVNPTIDLGDATVARASNVVLSPDGRYLGAEEDDNIKVYDAVTGADVTPDLGRYPFAVAYGWVDEDTAMVFGIKDLDTASYDVDLLSCDVPTGSCAVVSSTQLDGGASSFVLPVGLPLDT